MNINKNCNLVLNDIYLYDIAACHYTILDRLGFSTDVIDKNNKKLRNIQIGYLMKDNQRLTSILRHYTESIVNEFILRNNIKENEIICHQYDGLLVTRPVLIFDQYINFGLREIYQNLIISDNRNSYIAINDKNKIMIKGITNRHDLIDNYYLRLLKINYSNKKSIFRSLHKIKNEIYNNKDPEVFCIPMKDKNDKYEVFLKKYGKIKVSGGIINMLDIDEIDKRYYFKLYLEPFFNSIVITYI